MTGSLFFVRALAIAGINASCLVFQFSYKNIQPRELRPEAAEGGDLCSSPSCCSDNVIISQDRGTPIYYRICYSPSYGDRPEGTHNLGKLPWISTLTVQGVSQRCAVRARLRCLSQLPKLNAPIYPHCCFAVLDYKSLGKYEHNFALAS